MHVEDKTVCQGTIEYVGDRLKTCWNYFLYTEYFSEWKIEDLSNSWWPSSSNHLPFTTAQCWSYSYIDMHRIYMNNRYLNSSLHTYFHLISWSSLYQHVQLNLYLVYFIASNENLLYLYNKRKGEKWREIVNKLMSILV